MIINLSSEWFVIKADNNGWKRDSDSVLSKKHSIYPKSKMVDEVDHDVPEPHDMLEHAIKMRSKYIWTAEEQKRVTSL